MTSLLVTKTLFANKINTIAVFAVLEATIIFQKYCSTIQRAKYGTLGRFGLTLNNKKKEQDKSADI